MKKYSLQEAIVPTSVFIFLIKKNILPYGIDVEGMPNNLDNNTLDILDNYYELYKENDINMMILNLPKLEDDYAKSKISFKKYIKIDHITGEINIFKIRALCTVRSIKSYYTVIIQPYFSCANSKTNFEYITIYEKIEELLNLYHRSKEQDKSFKKL